jgi:hypothetical protein
MIYAAPASSREAVVQGFPTGLAGTVGFQVIDNVGGVTIARTTAGITERPAGSGIYTITFTVPASLGDYTIVWDKGSTAPSNMATEELVVTYSSFVGAGPQASDLCSLADVRLAMETPAGDTALDAEIQDMISDASERILADVSRELVPLTANPATRRFRVDGYLVDLEPFDLRAVTSVTLHPESSSPVVLSSSDYALKPIADRWGVYNRIQLSRLLVLYSDTMLKQGFCYLDVAGTWGFASVPRIAKRACINAVRSWLRRDMATYASIESEGPRAMQPDVQGYYALPSSSRRMLDPLRRMTA